jgi:hypothetical protein
MFMSDLHRRHLTSMVSQAPVAHAYNPSYSGGRDWEDCSSKPTQGRSSQDPISKMPNTKKGWWSSSSGSAPP